MIFFLSNLININQKMLFQGGKKKKTKLIHTSPNLMMIKKISYEYAMHTELNWSLRGDV